jgi:hypothetical protein
MVVLGRQYVLLQKTASFNGRQIAQNDLIDDDGDKMLRFTMHVEWSGTIWN